MSEEKPEIYMEWQASEYVHHKKDVLWYALFGGVIILMIIGLYTVLRDLTSVVVIALMAVSLLVFAGRPPKTLRYALTDLGIEIGERKYPYESFKSFSVANSNGIESVLIDPIHRFMPPITVYFEPQHGDKIFQILSNQLPYSEYNPDIVDKITEKIRF